MHIEICSCYDFFAVPDIGEIRDLWAKIYILFDAIPTACRKWLKVGFGKVRRVPIIFIPQKNQNLL